ncbi:MAG: hypothetical protein A2Y61_04570 [Chloroflexi bacterium RBG_13_60_13]|nr:MAG: hypothetical protein A2Y61_04570 [Chloroflexi bacterium RBG_13_60_13]
MIWLRRVFTIPLILLFVVIFIALLFTTHLSGSLGSSGFYEGQLRRADIYNWLYDDLMPVALDEFEETQGNGLPIPLHVIKDDLIAVTKETLPPEWLRTKVESGLDEIVPYLVGDRDSFTIQIQPRDRIDILAPAVIEVAGEPEIYDYLMYELVSRQILSDLGQAVDLPFEVTISQGEVLSAVTRVLPPTWVQERLSEIIYELADYLKGDIDRMDIVVDLTDAKAAALDRVADLADQRLEAAFNALPQCSEAEFQQALLNLPEGSLPDCRPVGVDYEGFKSALGIDVASSVDQLIGDEIPDSWFYTDEQLRQSMGEDNADLLDSARDVISNGNTLTEADLRDAITDNDDSADLQTFDDVRHRIHDFRTWLWVLWLIPILLLVGIGLLGGRSWRTRLVWALAVLFFTCLVTFIVLAAIQANVIDEHARTLVGDPSEYQGAELVMTEKGNEIAYNAISGLASGMQNKALCIMICSGLVALGIIIWMVVESRRNRRLPADRYSSPTSSQSITG